MSAFSTTAFWQQETNHHRRVADATFSALESDLCRWVDAAVTVVQSGGKILFCGNGGSAADAQHIAAELSVKLCAPRPAIAALCLSLDPSAMTACANDFGYDHVFSRQVEALGRPGDMLVGISTSGKSPNVLKATDVAKAMGMKTVCLTGEHGGPLAPLCDISLKVPCADSTARIQEMHIFLGHIFCGALEKKLDLA